MTRTRIALITSSLIAGVLLVQSMVLTLWGLGFQTFANAALAGSSNLSGVDDSAALWAGLPLALFFSVLDCAAFGLGVFLSLRFVKRIDDKVTWKHVVVRAALATVLGAVAVFIVRLLETILRSVTAGPYPFGYSFTPTFDSLASQTGLLNALGGLLPPAAEDAPLVILVCVFLRFWLSSHPAPAETKARASASA